MRAFWILILTVAACLAPQKSVAQSVDDVVKGAQVWAANCMRCHNARSPLERTDREWYTIVQHMRARANLTRSEAQTVSVYLQVSNGVGTVPAATDAGVATSKAAPAADARETGGLTAPDERISRADSVLNQLSPKEMERLRELLRREGL